MIKLLGSRHRQRQRCRKHRRVRPLVVREKGSNCNWCGVPLVWVSDVPEEDRIERGSFLLKWRDRETNEVKIAYFGTLDHVVPHCDGGETDVVNLVPCCQPCNAARSVADQKLKQGSVWDACVQTALKVMSWLWKGCTTIRRMGMDEAQSLAMLGMMRGMMKSIGSKFTLIQHVRWEVKTALVSAMVTEVRKSKRLTTHSHSNAPEPCYVEAQDMRREWLDVFARCDLTERESTVLDCRYFRDMKLREVADQLGNTTQNVSASEMKGLAKLRMALNANDF